MDTAMAEALVELLRPLVVFIVFFGELPPWLPLTLQSMAANANVSFVVVGDAAAPAVLPPNVHFEQIGFVAMQTRLSEHIAGGNRSAVRYTFHYKANDIKPLAAELYPHLAAGYEWWAWADLDVVFGDLLKFLRQASTRPACCKVPLKLKGPHRGEPKRLSAVNVYTHKVTRTRASARAPLPKAVLLCVLANERATRRAFAGRMPVHERRAGQRRLPALPQPVAQEGVGSLHGVPLERAAPHRRRERQPDAARDRAVPQRAAVDIGHRVGRLRPL